MPGSNRNNQDPSLTLWPSPHKMPGEVHEVKTGSSFKRWLPVLKLEHAAAPQEHCQSQRKLGTAAMYGWQGKHRGKQMGGTLVVKQNSC